MPNFQYIHGKSASMRTMVTEDFVLKTEILLFLRTHGQKNTENVNKSI